MSAINFGVQSSREIIDQPLKVAEPANVWERLKVKAALAKSYTPIDSIVRGGQHLYAEVTGGPDLDLDELKAMNKDVKWDSPMNKERAKLTIERHNNVKQANKYIANGEDDESFTETVVGLGVTLVAHAIDPTYWVGGIAAERGIIAAASRLGATAAKAGKTTITSKLLTVGEKGLELSTAGRAIESGFINYAAEAGIMGAMSKVELQQFEHSQARNAAIIGIMAPFALKGMGKTWQRFKNKNVLGRAADYTEQQLAKGDDIIVDALEEVVEKGPKNVDAAKLRKDANHPSANSIDGAINNPKVQKTNVIAQEAATVHDSNISELRKMVEVTEGAEALDDVSRALKNEVGGDLVKADIIEDATRAAERIIKGGCDA